MPHSDDFNPLEEIVKGTLGLKEQGIHSREDAHTDIHKHTNAHRPTHLNRCTHTHAHGD